MWLHVSCCALYRAREREEQREIEGSFGRKSSVIGRMASRAACSSLGASFSRRRSSAATDGSPCMMPICTVNRLQRSAPLHCTTMPRPHSGLPLGAMPMRPLPARTECMRPTLSHSGCVATGPNQPAAWRWRPAAVAGGGGRPGNMPGSHHRARGSPARRTQACGSRLQALWKDIRRAHALTRTCQTRAKKDAAVCDRSARPQRLLYGDAVR